MNLLMPLWIETSADVVGGNNVASLGARLRAEASIAFEEELMLLNDRSCAL